MKISVEVEALEDLMPFDEFGRKLKGIVLQTRQALYETGHYTDVEIHLSKDLWTVLVDEWPDYYLRTEWERGETRLSSSARAKVANSFKTRMIEKREIIVYWWHPVVLDVVSSEGSETIWVIPTDEASTNAEGEELIGHFEAELVAAEGSSVALFNYVNRERGSAAVEQLQLEYDALREEHAKLSNTVRIQHDFIDWFVSKLVPYDWDDHKDYSGSRGDKPWTN